MCTSADKISKDMPFQKCSFKTNDDEISLKRGKLLHVIAVFFLLQGLCFLTASFLDNSLKILPTDPLSMIGIVSMASGVVMLIVGTIVKMWYCGGRCQLSNSGVETAAEEAELLCEECKNTEDEEKKGDVITENKKEQ